MRSLHLRKISALLLAMALMMMTLMTAPAYAASKKCVFQCSAKIYKSASTSSKVIASRDKGDKIVAVAVKGKWAKVKSGGKTGYVLKSKLTAYSSTSTSNSSASSKSSSSGYTKLSSSSKGSDVLKLQKRLNAKGYLSSSSVTGSYNAATKKAVRMFQLVSGLSASGTATSSTQTKLFSSSAKSKPNVSRVSWGSSGMSARFPVGSTATIVDLNSGIRLHIRRVGGIYHADVEPATASDTAKLNKIYGGTWSWASKGVLFICGGKYYAAAINGYPHGKQISTTNNFDGQFCLHLRGSKTHGTEVANANHQKNIRKVYNYFHS
jgi:peptidoglycan hydrolase-like protein with peptidoglycan-binding domain